jgi:prevent-host-death family protein
MNESITVGQNGIFRSPVASPGPRKVDGMAYEIPVTQARAELADLINRVVYGGERVVVTRHGKPLVALVSAADLERLEEEKAPTVDEQVVSSVSSVRDVASGPRERQRFGIAAEHRGTGAS